VPPDALAPVFAALADDVRRHVLERMRDEGTVTATGLARELPVTRQAISKHLAVLDAAGLVTRTREGRETRFGLRPEPLTEAIGWMAAVGGRWDARLDRLEDLVRRRSARTGRPADTGDPPPAPPRKGGAPG
jgi:DNA-binding transcriptional ArsR family regulator